MTEPRARGSSSGPAGFSKPLPKFDPAHPSSPSTAPGASASRRNRPSRANPGTDGGPNPGGGDDVADSGAATPVAVVRLSVNLAPDVAETLKALCANAGLNLTEGTKRAIKLWKLVEDVQSEGGRVLVESRDERGAPFYKEIVFL